MFKLFGLKDLVPQETIDVDLLYSIPTKASLIYFSVIVNELNFKTPEIKILRLALQQSPIVLKNLISELNYSDSNKEIKLFSAFHVMEFMMKLFENRNTDERELTESEVKYLFFGYLNYIDITNEILDNSISKNALGKDFNTVFWPLLGKQFQFNIKLNPFFHLFRSIVLIDEISKNSNYSFILVELEKVLHVKVHVYLLHLFRLLSINNSSILEDGLQVRNFYFKMDLNESDFTKTLTLDLSEIEMDSKLFIDYNIFKTFPLINHESYFIFLNKIFFQNKIYIGLIFSIKTILGSDKEFEKFKSTIGKKVSEERYFIPMLKLIYRKKYHKLFFSELTKRPDAYLRVKNKIFLFEFKDYLFPSSIRESYSYDSIIKYINSNFIQSSNGKNKGILQLIDYIHLLSENDESLDKFSTYKLRTDQIEIYPIIVYSDFQFSLPGINNYLTTIFRQKICITEFKKVHDPVLINIEFFNDYYPFLINYNLDYLIEDYINKVNQSKNNYLMSGKFDDWLEYNHSFEYLSKFRKLKKDEFDYFKEFVTQLGINEALLEAIPNLFDKNKV